MAPVGGKYAVRKWGVASLQEKQHGLYNLLRQFLIHVERRTITPETYWGKHQMGGRDVAPAGQRFNDHKRPVDLLPGPNPPTDFFLKTEN